MRRLKGVLCYVTPLIYLLLLLVGTPSVVGAVSVDSANELSPPIVGISLPLFPHRSHLIIHAKSTDCHDPLGDHSYSNGTFSNNSLATAEATVQRLKRMAEEYLGERRELREAVVAVPVSWTDKQRDTLKSPTFAQETGLRVIRVVNRPTAACIAYNLHQQPVPDLGEGDEGFEGRLVLVVDVLGQLDDALELEVTLLEIEDGVFEILASAQGREAELREVMDGVLKQANMTPSRVNHVLSVGEIHLSSTLTETLSSLVPGGELYDTSSVGPHLASAYGAAVQADILSVRSCLGEPIVGNFDVTSLSLGIETSNSLLRRIVPRNSILPLNRTVNFTTGEDGQTSVAVRLFAGEFPLAVGNRLVGLLELRDLPSRPAGDLAVVVTLEVDAWYENIRMSVKEPITGRTASVHTPVVPSRGEQAWAEIEKMIMAVEELDLARERGGEARPLPAQGLPPPTNDARIVSSGRDEL